MSVNVRSIFLYVPLVCVSAVALVGVWYVLNPQSGNSENSTILLRTEPLAELRAHEHDIAQDTVAMESHHKYVRSSDIVIDEDVFVTRIDFGVENAPETVVHHAGLFDAHAPLHCASGFSGGFFALLAEDHMHTTYAEFPSGYALKIPKGTRLVFESMLHNPEPPIGPGGSYTDVSVWMKLTVANPTQRSALTPLSYQQISLVVTDPCAPGHTPYLSYTVPPRQEKHIFSSPTPDSVGTVVFEKPTRIVYWGGHTHGWEGGKRVHVLKNGKRIHTFETQNSATNPYRYDTSFGPTNHVFEVGDVLTLQAEYENKTEKPILGAMGAIGIFTASMSE